jgi:3-methyl-2-oxobutanoate hydroxymethyltransferase
MKSAEQIRKTKGTGRLAVLTVYDYPMARALDVCDLDILLVGDTLGEVIHGFQSTSEVTMEMMLLHVAAVKRGVALTHILADLPYLSYEDPETALKNALLLMKAGADSVKLEGNKRDVVEHLVKNEVPVVGHVGLTPQTIHEYRMQGKDESSAAQIFEDAKQLESAGCFAIVLECIPQELAGQITEDLKIPTIGIGAGPDCDGQVLVLTDVLGLTPKKTPFYVKKYGNLAEEVQQIGKQFADEVRAKKFPRLRTKAL